MGRNGNGNHTHYAAVDRSDVPQGRKGKHRKAVADILADLTKLKAQQAVKIPLSSLNGEKMQNLRSALNRVTRERNIPVETTSDEKYLYVWRADQPNLLNSPELRFVGEDVRSGIDEGQSRRGHELGAGQFGVKT
ncbi:MAG TPA: hypothetical protein VKQ11_07420 [Candidatus Sulfotelmatobacter sp.]|nr:hypothetical protein [Candidatus Sulfotelmatobacter sp.]